MVRWCGSRLGRVVIGEEGRVEEKKKKEEEKKEDG